MERLFRLVLDRPGTTLGVALAISAMFALPLLGVRVDNGAAVWLPRGDTELERQRGFLERFGDDAVLLAASGAVDVGDEGVLRRLGAAATALGALEGVARVDTPLAVGGPSSEAQEDLDVLRAAVARHPDDAELGALLVPATARALAAAGGPGLSTRPLARALVGTGRLALLVVARPELDAAGRSALVGAVEEQLAAVAPELGPWELAGTDVVTRDLDRGSARSLATLFPLVLALMAGVLAVALRSWRAVAAIAAADALASVWTLGLLAATGRTLNLLLVVAPAILVVVGAAYALHLVARFQHLEPTEHDTRAERAARWRTALGATFPPCLLTALTTAAGFAALGLSRLPPVRDLGMFTAFGVLVVFALVFTLVPALLVRCPAVVPLAPRRRRFTPERAARVAVRIDAARWPILGLGLGLGVVALVGISRLQVESFVLGFFAPDHPLPRHYASIERDFFGLTSVELVLSGPREAALSAEALAELERVEEFSRAEPLAQGAPRLSALGGALEALPPRARGRLLAAWIDGAGDASAARSHVWTDDARVALRSTLSCRTSSSNAVHGLVERLRAEVAAAALPDGVELGVAGSAPLLVRGQVLLLQTQLTGFAGALASVSLVLGLALRSGRLLALSLVPNVLPIALVLGAMGLAGIALDTATVTVAGIALGLVVDDTIHLLFAWRAARRAGLSPRRALASTLERVGRPIVSTTLALAIGFGAFGAASFRPTFYFGLLIAGTGLAALVCDLLLLPALLLVGARAGGRDQEPASGAGAPGGSGLASPS